MSRVLVVDDSATHAAMLVNTVLRHYQGVEIETTGVDGLSRAIQGNFDLIILDFNLPDIDGMEICRQYKAAGRTTPIMLVSSEDQLNRINQDHQSEVAPDYYCTKDLKAIEARVETFFLRQRRQRMGIKTNL
jgi:DNA-binding response OmpR family regulator